MALTKEDKIGIIQSMMINHETLNPLVFDNQDQMFDDKRENLLKIANFIIEKSVAFFPHAQIKDIVLIGSICSYIYTESSDMDLFVFVDNIVPDNDALSNVLLKNINFSILQSYQPQFLNHPVDFGVLHVSNERIDGRNNYSLLRNEWNQKPVRKQLLFTAEELFSHYCQYSAQLHQFVASLDKINNAFLTQSSCAKLTEYLHDLRSKAFDAKDNSPEHEYSLDYYLYRILKRFGAYAHFQKYLIDSYKNLMSKKP